MRPAKVVVAMSGGVDSSVAAALLAREGHEVVGITLDVWPRDEDSSEDAGATCCGLDAVEEARRVCHKLEIPHYVLNFRDVFDRAVISDFCDEYRRGRTPNPCIRCNERVKFDELLRRSAELGAEHVATGHHARIGRAGDGTWILSKAVDLSKDQSYVLYMLDQSLMPSILLPIGEMMKSDVRETARMLGLRVADRPESQEICFAPPKHHAAFVRSRGAGSGPGEIVSLGGETIGRHDGIEGYTVGQRKGLGSHAGPPQYVVAVDANLNRVVVGDDADLYASGLLASDVRWCRGTPRAPLAVKAKVRYNMEEAAARVEALDDGMVRVSFEEPQRAITPGQAVVFYDVDSVLGGATIESAVRR